MDGLEKTFNNWKRGKLTLLGKINIVKSSGLSKLIYNAAVLPVPKNFCDQVNIVSCLILSGTTKKPKLKKNTIIGERKNGGLKMIDFTLNNKALKSIWIKRFHLSDNSAWTVIPNEATSYLGARLTREKLNYKSVAKEISKPPFLAPEVQWASEFTVFF